jgi:Ca2+-binding EF-hand superfamily protein
MCRLLAVIAGCCALASYGWAEDKQEKPRQNEPAQATKPADTDKSTTNQKPFDVDAFIKKYDRNGDGVLDRNELPALLQRRFADMDSDKDGKLSRDELRQHVDILRQSENIAPHRRERMLDLVQLVGPIVQSDEPGREIVQRVYDILQQIDSNGDGKIDRDEWEAMRQHALEWRVNAMLERQGAAQEGKVSKENARGRLRHHFDEWDLNHDGFVDRDELMKALSGQIPHERPQKKERVKVVQPSEKQEK